MIRDKIKSRPRAVYQVWQGADPLAEDIALPQNSSQRKFIQHLLNPVRLDHILFTGSSETVNVSAKKSAALLTAREKAQLKQVSLVVVLGEDFLYFADPETYQALRASERRQTIYWPEGLWDDVKGNPEALAGALAHELSHLRFPWLRGPLLGLIGEGLAVLAEKRADPSRQLRASIDSLITVPFIMRKFIDEIVRSVERGVTDLHEQRVNSDDVVSLDNAHYWEHSVRFIPASAELAQRLIHLPWEQAKHILDGQTNVRMHIQDYYGVSEVELEKRNRLFAAFQLLSESLQLTPAAHQALEELPADAQTWVGDTVYTKTQLRRAAKRLEVLFEVEGETGSWIPNPALASRKSDTPRDPPTDISLDRIQHIYWDDPEGTLEPLAPDPTREKQKFADELFEFERSTKAKNTKSAAWLRTLLSDFKISTLDDPGAISPEDMHFSIAALLGELNDFLRLIGLPAAFIATDTFWEIARDVLVDLAMAHPVGRSLYLGTKANSIRSRIVSEVAKYYSLKGFPIVWTWVRRKQKGLLFRQLTKEQKASILSSLDSAKSHAWVKLMSSIRGMRQGNLSSARSEAEPELSTESMERPRQTLTLERSPAGKRLLKVESDVAEVRKALGLSEETARRIVENASKKLLETLKAPPVHTSAEEPRKGTNLLSFPSSAQTLNHLRGRQTYRDWRRQAA